MDAHSTLPPERRGVGITISRRSSPVMCASLNAVQLVELDAIARRQRSDRHRDLFLRSGAPGPPVTTAQDERAIECFRSAFDGLEGRPHGCEKPPHLQIFE